MLELLWTIPALPLASFVILALVGRRIGPKGVAMLGAGSVGASAVIAGIVAATFMAAPPADHEFRQTLWTWMSVGRFTPQISLYLDPLAIVMMLVVTFVGFLIHLYSTEFMAGEEGYSRFFAYMNLFVAAMLTLVLAGNLLLLYVGWEGVGLCSFLLIGFWYADPANGRAARKAFIVTRVGDTALMIGLLLLFTHFGTLEIQPILRDAPGMFEHVKDTPLAIAIAALLLGGALGKSAQLPLQTWLPDAMAGPTPVSALIHAATMVTAGVYLIARTYVLFEMAPTVLLVVAIIGAATLLYAGFSALVQRDIKRVLAYSTISQIGYMFLALGVGAWSAAIFHFMTHAFFKSLLFLGAGVVILAMDHEHDMFKMGGLRWRMPLVFWTFLVGACSLSALPLVTAGFYSKDMILTAAYVSPYGGKWLWAAGIAGAFLTSLYTFRMVFLTFFGQAKTGPVQPSHYRIGELGIAGIDEVRPRFPMAVALVILAVLSVVGGVVELPGTLGDWPKFSGFLEPTFWKYTGLLDVSSFPRFMGLQFVAASTELVLQSVAAGASLLGIAVAWRTFLARPATATVARPTEEALRRFWLAGWGFDWLYDQGLVRPFVWIARLNRDDIIDTFFDAIAALASMLHRLVSLAQTGRVRWYAAGIALGAVLIIAVVIWGTIP